MAGPLAEFATGRGSRGRFWLVDYGHQLAGSVATQKRTTDEAELRWMLLMPKLRGKGLGWFLLRDAITFCREQRYRYLTLVTVDVLADARRLYEASGFKKYEVKMQTLWSTMVTLQRYRLKL